MQKNEGMKQKRAVSNAVAAAEVDEDIVWFGNSIVAIEGKQHRGTWRQSYNEVDTEKQKTKQQTKTNKTTYRFCTQLNEFMVLCTRVGFNFEHNTQVCVCVCDDDEPRRLSMRKIK